MTKYVSLPGSGQCAVMDLGPLEGGYLELLNSNADPFQLYHLYDQMDLAGEEEMELCSGGLFSLSPLPTPQPAARRAATTAVSAATELQSAPMTAPVASRNLLLMRMSPSPTCLSHLPHQPSSQIFPASSKGLFPTEPDMDTINCEQFSRMLCDIEGDEETREAYANIGEKVL